MRVQHIDNNNLNVNIKGLSKNSKIGMYSLITSVTMFMFTNAMDTYEPKIQQQKPIKLALQAVASTLGILGTVIGLNGIEQDDKNKQIKDTQKNNTIDLKG